MTPTHEQTAQWAREEGFSASVGVTNKDGRYAPNVNALGSTVPIEWLHRFAIRAMAAQAEADAKLCDPEPSPPNESYVVLNNKATMRRLAASIRANAPKV